MAATVTQGAVFVVDMQEYFCKPGNAFLRFITALGGSEETTNYVDSLDRTVIPNIRKLVDRARARGDLVVVSDSAALGESWGSCWPRGTPGPAAPR